MKRPFPTRGLYAITQTEGKNHETIIQDVYLALQGGASIIQYRNKKADDSIYLAKELLLLCKQNNAPLIINDDAELAAQIGATGVHIGQHDGDILAARNIAGADAIIGISCYDDINRALKAESQGADYVAFGRFFPSNSKPLALPAHIDTLSQAKKKIKCPIVAIGGILPENGQQLLHAGADILAVIGGIFDQNPKQSAQAYLKLFNC